MKVEILKENLKQGLGIMERSAGKNLSLPILNNVLLSAEDSFLNLTSTDLEMVVKLWILSKVVQRGSAVMPTKVTFSFISSLPNEKVTIETKSNNLYIESKNFKTQIQGFSPEEFPIIPKFKEIESLTIQNKNFYQGLSQVVAIASSSQNKPEIAGIFFSFSKNKLTIAATDSFRLAEKKLTLEGAAKKEYSCILPQKTAKDLVSILEGKEGILTISLSENQVLFEFPMEDIKHPQLQVTSRLIEGQYPNYQDIIPSEFKTKMMVKKDEFLNQIKMASLFSNRNNEIKILVNPEKQNIEIFSQNPTIGENKSSLEAKVEGVAIEVSFNCKFLIDGVQNIKSSEILFNISKEDGPSVLKPVGDESYLYVVMPIKPI